MDLLREVSRCLRRGAGKENPEARKMLPRPSMKAAIERQPSLMDHLLHCLGNPFRLSFGSYRQEVH